MWDPWRVPPNQETNSKIGKRKRSHLGQFLNTPKAFAAIWRCRWVRRIDLLVPIGKIPTFLISKRYKQKELKLRKYQVFWMHCLLWDFQYLLTFVWLNQLNLLIGEDPTWNLGMKWATSMWSRGIWLVLPKLIPKTIVSESFIKIKHHDQYVNMIIVIIVIVIVIVISTIAITSITISIPPPHHHHHHLHHKHQGNQHQKHHHHQHPIPRHNCLFQVSAWTSNMCHITYQTDQALQLLKQWDFSSPATPQTCNYWEPFWDHVEKWSWSSVQNSNMFRFSISIGSSLHKLYIYSYIQMPRSTQTYFLWFNIIIYV